MDTGRANVAAMVEESAALSKCSEPNRRHPNGIKETHDCDRLYAHWGVLGWEEANPQPLKNVWISRIASWKLDLLGVHHGSNADSSKTR